MKTIRWILGSLFLLALAEALGAQTYPAGTLPNPKLTPGHVAISKKTHKQVQPTEFCVPGYSKKLRNVPDSVKVAVFKEYGVPYVKGHMGNWEIDHLCSLELGCDNDKSNLWAQSYITKPYNAHVKDAVENRTHALVCSSKMDFKQAQRDIETDWVALGKREGIVK